MPDKNSYLLPAVIVVAGIILGVSIYMVRDAATAPLAEGDISLLRPVSTSDHVAGNPAASVVIVAYSDIDCQYCKSFHEVLEQVITDYSATGEVAWVYRHFPLTEVHPAAATHAEAAECVASLSNDRLFFRFIDALHQAAPDLDQFDPAGYPAVISGLGLSPSEFETCMEGTAFEKRIADDFGNAIDIGAGGAPFSVILTRGHKPVTISGALPYEALKKVVETSLQKAATPPTE